MTDSSAAQWRDLLEPIYFARAALVVLGIWLNAADGLVTVTLMPSVVRDLGGVAYYGWAVAVFLTASILAGASAGQFAQRAGLRVATLVAAIAYTAGCVMSAASSDMALFLAGRALQGFGAGWIVGFCYVAIEAVFPEKLWARLFAAAAGAWGVASVVGPLVGGLFSEAAHWRGAFWMFAAQGVVFAIASAVLLDRSDGPKPSASKLAWKTMATLAVAVALIGTANITVTLLTSYEFLLAGLATFIAALAVNGQAGERLLPRDVGRPWTVAGAGYAMIFALEVGTVGLNVYQAAIIQIVYGVPAIIAGYVVAAVAMGWTVAAFFVTSAPEHRHGQLILGGAGVIVAGYALLSAMITRVMLGWIVLDNMVIGCGFGMAWSLLAKRIITALPDKDRALGASAIPTTSLIGGAMGAAAAGAMANLLGLSRNFTAAGAEHIAPLLFAASLPIVGVGGLAALKVARPLRSAPT